MPGTYITSLPIKDLKLWYQQIWCSGWMESGRIVRRHDSLECRPEMVFL